MKFSVIVAFENQYELMSNFVENLVLNTDFSEGELLLVSDGCRDRNTLLYLQEKAKQLKRFRLVELDRQYGYSKANNFGVRESCGEILAFLHEYLNFYNHKRPHSSICNQTPAQAEEIYFKKQNAVSISTDCVPFACKK